MDNGHDNREPAQNIDRTTTARPVLRFIVLLSAGLKSVYGVPVTNFNVDPQVVVRLADAF